MGKEGNALYCFTKAHFICKNAIDTLEKIHMVNTSHIPSYRLNLLPKRTDQNVKLVQTNVTRDSKLQHFIHYCNDSFNNSTATTVNHEAIFLASNLITEASNYFPRPPKTNYTYNTNIIQ